MAVVQGKRRGVRVATIAAGLLMLSAPSVRAADPWPHLSIPQPTTAAPRVAATAAIVPVAMHLPRSPYGPIANTAERPYRTAESMACLVTGSAATLAALGLGWENVTNLISGGLVAGAGAGAAALGLFGVVFLSFCTIGQALTPLYLEVLGSAPSSAGTAPPATPPSPPL
jgi:hypothetical protein